MKRAARTIQLLAVAVFAAGAGYAQTSATPKQAKPARVSPCKDDIVKFCSGQKGKYAACLKQNESQLSPACKSAVDEMGKPHGLLAACQEDKAKFCASAKGGRALVSCLEQNNSSLSESCSKFLASMPKKGSSVPKTAPTTPTK